MKWLIVVDMQNDFISGALGSKEAQGIVENVIKKIEKRHAEGYRIVYTRDTHKADYLSTAEGKKLPVEHCIEGTQGHEIAKSIPVKGDIIDKPTFGSVALVDHIKQSGGGSAIELVGLCTDICVISNAMLLKASFPECEISVDASCCAGVTPQSHENALEAMKMCHIDITRS